MSENAGTSETADGLEDHNPPPPTELGPIPQGDAIGETLFSERWVVKTLMGLTQLMKEKYGENVSFDYDEDTIQELDPDIEIKLEQLWDMSTNKDVATFLISLPTLDLICDAMAQTKIPRLTEISAGILANMACVDAACETITANEKLRTTVLQLLDTSDAPTLVETFRFLLTCVQNKKQSAEWLKVIKQDENLLPHVTFIMASSTNLSLLTVAAEFVDFVLDVSDDLCCQWSTPEFVDSLLEAVRQIGVKSTKVVETFFRILQFLSTSHEGKSALNRHADMVVKISSSYLTYICEHDEVSGCESGLSAALLLMHILVLLSPDSTIQLLYRERTLLSVSKLMLILRSRYKASEQGSGEVSSSSRFQCEDDEPKMLREVLDDAVITLFEEVLDREMGEDLLMKNIEELNELQICQIITWLKSQSGGGQRCFQLLKNYAESSGCNRLSVVLRRLHDSELCDLADSAKDNG